MGLGTAAAGATVGQLVAGSTIAAGASSLFNGMMGGASASKEYEYARRLQKHDQAFQKEMRATQYQTTVDDMQKAGINPAVALSGGASASQAQGGSSQSAPNVDYGGIDIPSMMQAMAGTALTEAQKQNIEADTELKEKQTGKTKEETELIKTTKNINEIMANAELKKKDAETRAKVAEAIKQEYYNAYVNKYGHAPEADAMTKIGAKLEKFLESGSNWTGSKINTFVQSQLSNK